NPGDRPDPEHERLVPEPWHRAAVRRGLRLSVDGCELSDLWRPVRRDPGSAGNTLRYRHDAVHDRHHAERPIADGSDYGGRRRFRELDFACDLCARAAIERALRPPG